MCSECLANLQRHAVRLRPGGHPPPPGRNPTAADLERHAQKFGPGQVAETAAEYGLEVSVEAPQKRRSRGPSLKERVRRLVKAGHSVEVIAEIENLTPARARKLAKEVS